MSNVKITDNYKDNDEIAGAYCDYTKERYEEMVDFIQQAKSFTIDHCEYGLDFIFLIRRERDFLLTTGSTPQPTIDVKVNDTKGLQEFYYREIMRGSSKVGELL